MTGRPQPDADDDAYDWGAYIRRNQSVVYAPGWDDDLDLEERSRNTRFGVAVAAGGLFLFSFVIAMFVGYGYDANITMPHIPKPHVPKLPSWGGGSDGAKPHYNDGEDAPHRAEDILENLKMVSGPLVNITGTPQYQAARWIVNDKYKLHAKSPFLTQRYVLALIYFSMGGDNWSIDSWLNENLEECLWKKITCDGDSRVTAIALDSANLSGKLPPEIASLKQLEKVDFHNNHIKGVVPKKWDSMKSIEFLYLEGNELVGTIPESLCDLRKTTLLFLTADCDKQNSKIECACCTNCAMSGSYTFSSPQRATQIRRKISKISGSYLVNDESTPQNQAARWIIEDDSARLSSDSPFLVQRYVMALLYFALGGENWPYRNWLAGDKSECTYPGIACEVGSVVTISLVSSQLIGKLPSELSQITTLKYLDLSGNHISGSIDSSFAKLKNLGSLFLQSNDLVGDVPKAICNMPSLGDFKVDCSEVACSCCTNCQTADTASTKSNTNTNNGYSPPPVESNKPNAPAETKPRKEAIRDKLKEVLDYEKDTAFRAKALSWILSDSINPDAKNLVQRYVTAVIYFALGTDDWVDQDKDECLWEGITCDSEGRIVEIDAASNNLRGSIPDEISFLNKLKKIDMSHNHLVGEIPEGLTNLFFLETLHLYSNSFFSKEPGDLCYLTYGKLADLRLDCNIHCACCDPCGDPANDSI